MRKMRVLLIDIDSTIPNLALMKIARWHKNHGDEVGFNIADPDKIYASVIFKKNKHKVDGLQMMYPNAEIDIGGSGYDIHKKLPDEIDMETPDYSIYPNNDRYFGFTSRGCIRNCYFCIVREKEGKFRHNVCKYGSSAHDLLRGMIDDYDETKPRFNKLEFMDNNILADKEWFFEVTDAVLEFEKRTKRRLHIDFNQGLDIRLVDDDIAKRLHEMCYINTIKFAFDSMGVKDAVTKGIECLKRNGVAVRSRCLFYVYVHDDDAFEDAYQRCMILKELGATPYPMLNQDVKQSQRNKDLKRWCRPWLFWISDLKDYERSGYDVESYHARKKLKDLN